MFRILEYIREICLNLNIGKMENIFPELKTGNEILKKLTCDFDDIFPKSYKLNIDRYIDKDKTITGLKHKLLELLDSSEKEKSNYTKLFEELSTIKDKYEKEKEYSAKLLEELSTIKNTYEKETEIEIEHSESLSEELHILKEKYEKEKENSEKLFTELKTLKEKYEEEKKYTKYLKEHLYEAIEHEIDLEELLLKINDCFIKNSIDDSE
jgi:hypothetical protein